MNWRCIFNKSILSLLLIAGIGLLQHTHVHATDWEALENPAFRDLPLTQAELNEQSAIWVKSLKDELRKFWDAEVRGRSMEDWLASQEKEVEVKLIDMEGGSMYPLAFNVELADLILQELRKYKNG